MPLKVTLKRSLIGTTETQKATVKGLGLRKIGSTNELPNTPAVRGMVRSILHMVDVAETTPAPAKARSKKKEAANG